MPTVRVPANYLYLAEISKFVGDAAREADMDSASVYAVQLAVDEACSNIIEHAYEEKGGGEIQCTCEIVADGLKITLLDQGNPFNPEDVPELDLHAELNEIKAGGAGIYLMHRMMDQVRYETDPNAGNKLVLVKRKGKK